MHWAIVAHISPKNGRIHHSKFPSAGNVHGNKNYAFSQCKSCLHIADFHQPTLAVQHIGGAPCYGSWLSGSDSDGRVYERLGEAPDAEAIPRTGTCTVQITPAQRRPRVS